MMQKPFFSLKCSTLGTDTHPMPNKSPISVEAENKANLSMDERFVLKLRDHILENLTVEDYSVEDLAQEVAFSRSHLYRKLQGLTGLSISQFIRNVRLEKAYELLKAEVATVSEIAYQVGFGSSTYFSKCFHEVYGFPPGELKKRGTETQTEVPPNSGLKIERKQNPIEALHPGGNGELIEELFRALLPFKPSLEKFLLIDEEEGESLDHRLLAYQAIKCFPWPLGVELRRLFSASFREVSEERYQQSLKTLRKTLRFCSFLMLAEILEHLNAEGAELQSLKGQGQKLVEAMERMEDDDLRFILQSFKPALEECSRLFIPELKSFLDSVLLLEVEDWLSKSSGESLELRCQTLDQSLNLILKKLGFLARYRLVNISEIRVLKDKFESASFEHQYHFLNAVDADFKVHSERLENFADSRSVLLMHSIKDTGSFLNLSPFLVDTFESDQKSGSTKRDVFLLYKVEKGQLYYEGSDLNRIEDLSNSNHYPIWLRAFQRSMQYLRKL